ncbi:FMN-binding negative transcriptional regulator [bacterium]|nr:MAG: FMN-binding negative transcriptional regulator [bacterium]
MYIPKHYVAENQEELLQFMKTYSFATIVTASESHPIATHLPFSIHRNESGTIILRSHFSIANPQWKDIESQTVLVIFSEPHAYISPTLYEKQENVPTWNYISVHAYGKGKVIKDRKESINILESMIHTYESTYSEQWGNLSESYINRLLNGIVSFEIEITNLQGKMKLSQNKTDVEKKNIVDSLSKSSDTNEKTIADYMNKRYFENHD